MPGLQIHYSREDWDSWISTNGGTSAIMHLICPHHPPPSQSSTSSSPCSSMLYFALSVKPIELKFPLSVIYGQNVAPGCFIFMAREKVKDQKRRSTIPQKHTSGFANLFFLFSLPSFIWQRQMGFISVCSNMFLTSILPSFPHSKCTGSTLHLIYKFIWSLQRM